MSRKRKFHDGDVAWWNAPLSGDGHVVVVDYITDARHRGRYRVVRAIHPLNGATYGQGLWAEAHHMDQLEYPTRPLAGRIYRANNKLEDRGCSCMCCAHEAIPNSMIRKDGSFTWTKLSN